jgi:hypothetical protein
MSDTREPVSVGRLEVGRDQLVVDTKLVGRWDLSGVVELLASGEPALGESVEFAFVDFEVGVGGWVGVAASVGSPDHVAVSMVPVQAWAWT